MDSNYVKSVLFNHFFLMIILLILFLSTGANVSAQEIKIKKRTLLSSEFEKLKNLVGTYDKNKNYDEIINGYGTGLKPPTKDEWVRIKDQLQLVEKVERPSGTAAIPSSLDNSITKWFPPIGNQAGENSCVSWACAYYTKTFQEAREHNWDLSGCIWEGGRGGHPSAAWQDKIFSPGFVYHQVNNGQNIATYYSDNMNLLKDIGCCTWDKMPYDPNDHTSWPNESAWRQAPLYRSQSGYTYMWLDTDTGMDNLKQILADGNLVVVPVYASLLYSLSQQDLWTLDNYNPTTTNHAGTVVGYDDNFGPYDEGGVQKRGAFKVANSWGTGSWEKVPDGFYYISYECMKQTVHYVMLYQNTIGYSPEMLAVFKINHDFRGENRISFGIGDPASPLSQKSLSYFPVKGGNYPYPNNPIVMDITEFVPNVSGTADHLFMTVNDGGSTAAGTIQYFSIEKYDNYTGGIPKNIFVSSETPVNTLQGGAVTVNVFTSQESITITYPAGGETFSAGSNPVIKFNSIGTSGHINLDYSTDGGTTWKLIASNVTDNGSYSGWTVPNMHSQNCKIRISDMDGNPSVISQGLFRIGEDEFTPISLSLLKGYTAAWGDYDNDGDLDLLFTAYTGSQYITRIYRNNGNNSFTEQTQIPLPDGSYNTADWGDYNNDGYLDILLKGYEGNNVIYRNNGDNSFEQVTVPFQSIRGGIASWGDYDNDGDLDVLITGDNGTSNISKIYKNNGNNTFTLETSVVLGGVDNSSAAWGDYNNDGYLDILLTGYYGNGVISKVYKNNGNNTFTGQSSISLTNVSHGSTAWGDYDNDGDLDILLTGMQISGGPISKIYRNNGNNSFTEQTSISLTGVWASSAAWGDYDNDGYLDILLTGQLIIGGAISKVYRNNGDNTFTEQTSISLSGDGNSTSWGDYDNDGDLDILIPGNSKIYRNNNTTPNTLPNAPANLKAVVNGNNVTFSWDKSSDKETPQNGLSYNLVIGTSPGAYNILSPMSDRNTGKRKITALGNANLCNSKTIKGLARGKYYWSVQAIDNNFAGSLFANEQSFSVGLYPNGCPNEMISYWKLNETSGTQYMDDVGPNTVYAVSTIPIPCAGRVGGAQQFNGSTTKLDASANPSFDFLKSGSFSVEFWYKGSTVPTTVKSAIGRYISSTGAKWWAGINAADGKARFYMSAGGASAAVNGTVITDGNWHHVAATRNGKTGSMKLYVDGVLRSSTTQAFTVDFTSTTAKLNIGWFSLQDAYTLNGSLDEVAIHNIELLASDIQTHYNNGLSGIGYCGQQLTAPIITSTPVKTAFTVQPYSYDVEATGNPAPVYSLVTYPFGMTINASTGLIQWTPTTAGSYNVTVEANNGVNPPAQQSFIVSVTSSPGCLPSMISYWKLNETYGTQYFDAAGPNPANAVSTAPVPCAGIVNGAQQFNGTTTKLNVLANSTIDFLKSGSFSVEFWYKGSTVPTTVKSAIGRYIANTGARWWAGLNAADGKARFYMSAGGASAAINGTVITDGNWHHVAATRNGKTGSMRLYVDGVLRSSTTQAFTVDFTSTTAKLNIGWFSLQDAYTLNGALDEVAIYNNELSLSDIQQHYNNVLSGMGYCPGIERASTDSSGYSLDWFKALGENNKVILSWKTSSNTAKGFEIEKESPEHAWEKIDYIDAKDGYTNYKYSDNLLLPEVNYSYRIKLISSDGKYIYSDVATVSIIPKEYKLFQNFPNPFNPSTRIRFSIPEAKKVKIALYNQLGELLAELVNQDYEAGTYEVEFNASCTNMASGMYFYKMEAGEFISVKKLLLLK